LINDRGREVGQVAYVTDLQRLCSVDQIVSHLIPHAASDVRARCC
jgi:hypothetical protein